MEESRKLRAEKLRVEKERGMYKDKLRIARKRLAELEGGANLITATLEEMNETQMMESTTEIFRQSRAAFDKKSQVYEK